ncbi:20218_t:CDS:2, partial [Funneliformis geosporum]
LLLPSPPLPLEEFKREHQQTCDHCQKREFPDMRKEISSEDEPSESKETSDKTTSKPSLAKLEKATLKKEVLTLREYTKELEKKSAVKAENSFSKAKETYENKYGKAELNALLTGSSQQQPKKNH